MSVWLKAYINWQLRVLKGNKSPKRPFESFTKPQGLYAQRKMKSPLRIQNKLKAIAPHFIHFLEELDEKIDHSQACMLNVK